MVRDVTIRFMGPIRKPSGVGATTHLSVEAEVTVDGLLTELGYQELERSRLRVMACGRTLNRSDPVGDAEELTVFLPLGGG